MTKFLLHRLWQGFIVVIVVTTVVFVITRLVGNPVDMALPLSATDAQRAEFARQTGLDRPIFEQFVTFVGEAVSLQFGDSLWQRRPAMAIFWEVLPNTLILLLAGIGGAIVASLFLGIFAAVRPGGLLDRAVTTVALVGLSLPQFWVGLMLIMFFAVIMKVLPTSGMGGPAYLVMPALTLALPSLARLTMLVRSSMIDELNKQYVKTARVKGMSQSSILFRHALRNILVPFLTLCGWELTYGLAGFTVVVESVFAWPGLGYTAMQAIQRNDPFLLQAIVICISFIIVIFNIGLDVLFKLIDPRIKIG
ncbi:MAG: hypothetical protein JWR39_1710 [Devosia sp.]|jgi:peptide/nickel transport system permease protein|nr:hypothetical protein [Devosia sp.]